MPSNSENVANRDFRCIRIRVLLEFATERDYEMFKRKIYDTLLEWKRNDAQSCALLIDGARRVGKSFIVEAFAKAEYRSYAIIDFSVADDRIKGLFSKYITKLDTFFAYL